MRKENAKKRAETMRKIIRKSKCHFGYKQQIQENSMPKKTKRTVLFSKYLGLVACL